MWLVKHMVFEHFFFSLFLLLHHVLTSCVFAPPTTTTDSVADVLHFSPFFQTARFAQTLPYAYQNRCFFFNFLCRFMSKSKLLAETVVPNCVARFRSFFVFFMTVWSESYVFSSPAALSMAASANTLVRNRRFCVSDRCFS